MKQMKKWLIVLLVVAQAVCVFYIGGATVLGKAGSDHQQSGSPTQPTVTPKQSGSNQQQSGNQQHPSASPRRPGPNQGQPTPQPQPSATPKRPGSWQPAPQPTATPKQQEHWQPAPQPTATPKRQEHWQPAPQPTATPKRQEHWQSAPQPTATPKRQEHWQPVPQLNKRYGVNNWELRNDARNIIRRTASVLVDAQQSVRRGHRYSGLAKAIALQRVARERYIAGKYRDAIYSSLRARELAVQIIRANKGRVKSEYLFDEPERYYNQERPNASQVDRWLEPSKMGKDNDALRIVIELDI